MVQSGAGVLGLHSFQKHPGKEMFDHCWKQVVWSRGQID